MDKDELIGIIDSDSLDVNEMIAEDMVIYLMECYDASEEDATNAVNEGNNDDTEPAPHWVFIDAAYITSPQAGYTVGRQPCIIGYTTEVNTAYTITGTSGGGTTEVASGTSDNNGNFRVVVDSNWST